MSGKVIPEASSDDPDDQSHRGRYQQTALSREALAPKKNHQPDQKSKPR